MNSSSARNSYLPTITEIETVETFVQPGTQSNVHRDSDTTLTGSPTNSTHKDTFAIQIDSSSQQEEAISISSTRAWLQVASGFCIQFILGGWAGCTGLFLLHYTDSLQLPEHDVAWITALESFFGLLPSTLVGLACDKGYPKTMLASGMILMSGGAVAVSFAAENYGVLVAIQGVVIGIAKSLIWVPSTFVICSYFEPRKLPLAFAVSKSGAGVGSMIFPVILECAQASVGFENTLRIMGGVSLGVCLIAYCILRPRKAVKAEKRHFLHFAAFKQLPYSLLVIASFLMVIGGSAGMTFFNAWGNDTFDMTEAQTLPINLVKEGVSIPAAAVSAWIAFRYSSSIDLDILLSAISAICYFCWIAVDSFGGMYAWMVIKGILHGGIACIAMAVVSQVVRSQKLFPDTPDLWGARLGMVATVDAVASLAGPLIFAKMLTTSGGDYMPGQLFCGFCLAIAAVMLTWLRVVFGKDMLLERAKMYV